MSPKHFAQLFRSRTGRKLALATLLFALAFIALATALQLRHHYQEAMGDIEDNFQTIAKGYTKSLAENLWVFNEHQLSTQLEGLKRFPHLEYLELREDSGQVRKVGKIKSRDLIQREFPLIHGEGEQARRLGTLKVVAGLDGVHRAVKSQAYEILLQSSLGAALLAGFILAMFHFLVNRRLVRLADSLRELKEQGGLAGDPRPLPAALRREDEIGEVAAAVDSMRMQLWRQMKALAASESQFRMLFDTSPVAIFTQDFSRAKAAMDELAAKHGDLRAYLSANPLEVGRLGGMVKLLQGNPATLELYEAESKEVLSRSLAALMPPEGSPHLMEQLLAFHRGDTRFEQAGRNLSLKGNTIEILVRKVVMPGHEQSLDLVLANLVDLTRLHKMREEKDRLEDQLRLAQKMEAIGTLAGGVAHDLNNLLSPIIGYAEIMAEECGHEQKAMLESVLQAGLGARDLVRQLLAFSRKQALEIKPVDLNQVAARFKKLLRRTIREDVAIVFELAESPLVVEADVVQLEQVIMNLVVNAQDAQPGGGRIVLETAPVELDQAYVAGHRGVSPGPHAMLAVSDSGHGMDKRTLDQIFDPFFTTKGKEKGTGLGLATVYGIVKQHGGHIWAYSEIDQGTTFKIYFPLSNRGIGKGEAPPADPMPQASGTETVLLAEDDRMVREMAAGVLLRHGYQVLAAASASQCLQLAAESPETPALLVTDVVMPDMNGKELSHRLQGALPGLKVLYMSGYTDNVIAHHGVLDEGVQFIQKPFSVAAFCLKVRQVLDSQ